VNDGRIHPRGFTLLELLVGTAITAVLAGSLYATLHIAFKARRGADAAVTQMRRAELAVELMRADIESAMLPKGILAGQFLGEDETDRAGRPMDSLVMHCTAGGAAHTEGTGDVRMVEFACEPAEDGMSMVLVRRVSCYLLATSVEEPEPEVICRGVRALDMKYFDGIDWQDSWDSTTRDNTLPLAVEVTMELVAEDATEGGEEGYALTRVLPVPCGATPEEPRAEAAP
jgi:type II secretion system protein J